MKRAVATLVALAMVLTYPAAASAAPLHLTVTQIHAGQKWWHSWGKATVATFSSDAGAILSDVQNYDDPDEIADAQNYIQDLQNAQAGPHIPFPTAQADWASYLRYTIEGENDVAEGAQADMNGDSGDAEAYLAEQLRWDKRWIPLCAYLEKYSAAAHIGDIC